MAWVAVDRAVQSAEQFGLPAPLTEWRALRDEIHAEVCDRGFNTNMGCFVQAYDTTLLDASLLMLPLVGFLPPDDPRIVATVECIEQRLLDSAGFVLRYDTARTVDGMPQIEVPFLACSFWLADYYQGMGRRADAQRLCSELGSL